MHPEEMMHYGKKASWQRQCYAHGNVLLGSRCSLSVGHYELCRDDIGDLPGSTEHL